MFLASQRRDPMAMTKIDIVQNVSDKLGISKTDSHRIVESMFEIMKEQLSKEKAYAHD